MQRAVRVRAVAVGVVRPERVELASECGQTNVVTIVDAVVRVCCVREPSAQALIRRPGCAAVGGKSAVVFGIIVRDHVRTAWTGYAVIIATIVKAHCDYAACGIKSDVRQELTVRGCVVVHTDRRGPRRAVISRCSHHNICVIVLINGLIRVHQVEAVVELATSRVPYQPGLSVDRASVLRWDEVETTDIGRRNGNPRAETAYSQTVGVHIDVDRRWTLSASRALIGHDDFAAVRTGSDSDTAEAAAS